MGRKYAGKLIEHKGYFTEVSLCRLILVLTFHLLHGHKIPLEKGFMAVLISQNFLLVRKGKFQDFFLHLLPENWVHLSASIAKRHNQTKDQEKEGFTTCSKSGEHQGSFPKQCLPKQQNWGSFKLRVHAYS